MARTAMRGSALAITLLLATAVSPGEVTDLLVSKSANRRDVVLNWTTGTEPYRVLRSRSATFISSNATVARELSTSSAIDAGAMRGARTSESYFYQVLGSD